VDDGDDFFDVFCVGDGEVDDGGRLVLVFVGDVDDFVVVYVLCDVVWVVQFGDVQGYFFDCVCGFVDVDDVVDVVLVF